MCRIDSWIYPALDRLAAFGLVDSAFAGDRPWTRRECARLLGEAEEHAADADAENSIAQGLINELEREFRPEMEGTDTSESGAFRVESLYSRMEYISGTPLRDGYHFGADADQRFWAPLWPRLEFGNRLFRLCHAGPVGNVFSRRMAGLGGFAGAASDRARNHSAGRPPSAAATGHRPAFREPVRSAGRLRGFDVFELAALVRAAKPVVGPGRRRSADLQRQRRAAQHVPHQSGHAASSCPASWGGWGRCGWSSSWDN